MAFAMVLSACGSAASSSMRRSLVTDYLHHGELRDDVIAWHDAHRWCRGPTSGGFDVFEACHVAMLDRHAPPVAVKVEYLDGFAVAVEVLVPVPCRVTGFCDRMPSPSELESPGDVPSMQRKTLDALEVELDARYGTPSWLDPAHTRMRWLTLTGETIVLALDARGASVDEVHLFPQ